MSSWCGGNIYNNAYHDVFASTNKIPLLTNIIVSLFLLPLRLPPDLSTVIIIKGKDVIAKKDNQIDTKEVNSAVDIIS